MKITKESTETAEYDKNFIKSILRHYKHHGRHDLIWRHNKTPYSVLVSEIMLQQTQVSRVIPKYNEWMKTFPTLHALAKANLQNILILWQGLGYQRRAKALHQIAKTGATLPEMYEELLLLPGIGTYTASAIMAFAYDSWSHPVLETNIRTVLIEYYYKNTESVHDNDLYKLLDRLIHYPQVQKAGACIWYSALMDYGAHLKQSHVSHNTKSKHNVKQSPYQGSRRQLRAKILFAVLNKNDFPEDSRTDNIIEDLVREGYLIKKRKQYYISN